jgi:signal transduction histidine kinase
MAWRGVARGAGQRLSLPLIAGLNIVLVSCLAVGVLIVGWLLEYYSDHNRFYRDYIALETDRLGACLAEFQARVILNDECAHSHYFGTSKYYYAFRIVDEAGRGIAAENSQVLENVFPAIGRVSTSPFSWQKTLDTGNWFHIAGGRPFRVGQKQVWIEVATLGDPAGQRFWALARVLMVRIWLPVLPLSLMILGFTMAALRSALQPLYQAAAAVENLDGNSERLNLDHATLPRDVSILTEAIDRLLARNHALMQSQRRLLAHSAHELRTPLAMLLLELGRSKDATSVRLAGDVIAMSEMINRLLSLTRLETLKDPPLKPVDLYQTEVIDRNKRLIESRSCQVSLIARGAQTFQGDPTSVHDAVRNLLENAVRHTPEGTRIEITCGPGRSLVVDDSGPGFPDGATEPLFEPFAKGQEQSGGAGLGLAIVKKAAELHRGLVSVRRSHLGGARVELAF